LTCGREFQYYPSEKSGKYCSPECYNKARSNLVSLVCDQCGVSFKRSACDIKSDLVFCSPECRLEHKRNLVEFTCKVCGKKFKWRASRAKYYATECCSKKCAGKARRRRVKRICKGCGVEFEIKESQLKRKSPRGEYCTKECYTEHACGKNSHMYDHGQSFYPYCEKFDDRLKERVRYFFGNKCVLSGLTKADNHNKRLDVHHVFIEKLACCETKIEEKDLVRKRLPAGVARIGEPEFSEEELIYIRMMVPMTIAEHSRVHMSESNDLPYEETKYRKFFAELILNKYGGKCYFTKEEFKEKKRALE